MKKTQVSSFCGNTVGLSSPKKIIVLVDYVTGKTQSCQLHHGLSSDKVDSACYARNAGVNTAKKRKSTRWLPTDLNHINTL